MLLKMPFIAYSRSDNCKVACVILHSIPALLPNLTCFPKNLILFVQWKKYSWRFGQLDPPILENSALRYIVCVNDHRSVECITSTVFFAFVVIFLLFLSTSFCSAHPNHRSCTLLACIREGLSSSLAFTSLFFLQLVSWNEEPIATES